ncbi:polysaccharide biosynthesis tyrosine autokinase [Actinomycetospora sp. NBRC 106378]|uniref:polysaccharide biosynthesis tyrosine autokinase n=1 Tax=Actinomycetospora sp. NBRC 106378 TaxID=3032208 RepID=UPI0024A1C897|nr:polysaccharide biosynthesis tyrosine autokinase [Actinomycetospora sp. NBRC 106378]GLZ51779.1 chromosome partitioning protein [Actinomycetospora sp. NBRC 106378]
MTLRDFLLVLRTRWRVVVACALVGAIAAAAFAALRPATYTSHVLLYVSSQQQSDRDSAYTGGLLSEQRVSSYVELVDRPSVTAEIVRRLGLTLTPEQLAGRISASAGADSVLIDVAVTDPSPAQATAIADTFGTVFPELVARIEQPRTPAGVVPVVVSPVEPATVPTAPASLGAGSSGLLGLLAGLLIGLLTVLVVDLLDTRITSRTRLESAAGRPGLGDLPLDRHLDQRPAVLRDAPLSPLAEAFRALRTNLRYVRLGGGTPVFLVTSARQGEGKSLTALNLALALAQNRQRVLLVDADLRRPSVAERTGLTGDVGLTTVLTGQSELTAVVQSWTDAPLDVLTSGALPPNPSELLGSDEMRTLLDEARAAYDVVLVDSPPVLPVADAPALAPLTDGVLLVGRHGLVTEPQVRAAVAALDAVGAHLFGVVLSAAPGHDRSGGYGYGYGAVAAPTAAAPAASEASEADTAALPVMSPSGPVTRTETSVDHGEGPLDGDSRSPAEKEPDAVDAPPVPAELRG